MKKLISSILIIVLLMISVPIVEATDNLPTFSLSNASGKFGDTIYVSLNIDNNPGITAFQLNINYSSTDLELISIKDNNLFSESVTYSQINKNPFIISWFSSNSENSTQNGKIATLEFKIISNTETSDIGITYNEENVFDNSFNNVHFETEAGKITAKKEVLGDVNGDGILSVADAIIIQKHIANVGILSDDMLNKADVTNDGIVSIADAIIVQKCIANII